MPPKKHGVQVIRTRRRRRRRFLDILEVNSSVPPDGKRPVRCIAKYVSAKKVDIAVIHKRIDAQDVSSGFEINRTVVQRCDHKPIRRHLLDYATDSSHVSSPTQNICCLGLTHCDQRHQKQPQKTRQNFFGSHQNHPFDKSLIALVVKEPVCFRSERECSLQKQYLVQQSVLYHIKA